MFSKARVKNSVRGRGVHGRGRPWQEVYVAGRHVRQGGVRGGEGHVWQGVCMAEGLHGRGHAWKGAWVAGGMCDRRDGLLLECIIVGRCVLAILE